MQKALYRKYRSATFDEVYGQDHITDILKYECAENKLSHAYLFCGSRGTGKTSCAKILAKAVNCLDPHNGNPCGVCESCRMIDGGFATDVLEMDAASNNGVDNIRELRDEVLYAPGSLKYRVYIIDEVHMLSASAFNALLKTLEEPPAHCIFILATTELNKLPTTIVSRCQRFDFKRISIENICKRLQYIASHEGFTLDEGAAFAIAKASAGGMRDAISMLELCASADRHITLEGVQQIMGSGGRESTATLVRALKAKDYDTILSAVHEAVMGSGDIGILWQEITDYYRDMLICKCASDPAKYLDLTDFQEKDLEQTAALFTRADILYHGTLLDRALFEMQKAPSAKRAIAELTLIRMCDEKLETSPEALLSRIEALENKLSSLSYSAIVPEEPKTEVTAEKKAKAETNEKKEPASVPTAESVVQKPASTPSQKKTNEGYTKFRASAELVDRLVKEGNFMLASFLERCRMVIDADGHLIIISSAVAADKIKGQLPAVARNVSPLLARPITEQDITVKTVETLADNDPLSEILKDTANS